MLRCLPVAFTIHAFEFATPVLGQGFVGGVGEGAHDFFADVVDEAGGDGEDCVDSHIRFINASGGGGFWAALFYRFEN